MTLGDKPFVIPGFWFLIPDFWFVYSRPATHVRVQVHNPACRASRSEWRGREGRESHRHSVASYSGCRHTALVGSHRPHTRPCARLSAGLASYTDGTAADIELHCAAHASDDSLTAALSDNKVADLLPWCSGTARVVCFHKNGSQSVFVSLYRPTCYHLHPGIA